MKTSRSFRLSDSALANLAAIVTASGCNETAAVEMALAALAKGLTGEHKMKRKFKLFSRSIDSGQGTQFVETDAAGTIRRQWLAGSGNHSYTGAGNPEFVGKNIKSLRGAGFRQERMSDDQYLEFISHD